MPFPCDQCQSFAVNGVPLHEAGCPEEWRDVMVACFECGCDFSPEERGQTVCASCADEQLCDLVACEDCNDLFSPDSEDQLLCWRCASGEEEDDADAND